MLEHYVTVFVLKYVINKVRAAILNAQASKSCDEHREGMESIFITLFVPSCRLGALLVVHSEVMISDGGKNRGCSRTDFTFHFKRRKLKIVEFFVCVNSELNRGIVKFQLAHLCISSGSNEVPIY